MAERREADTAKHLEFITTAVTRMAGNSFLLKGWALTTVGAVYSFAVGRDDWGIALMGALAVAGFFWLDAYYLRQERMFRALYEGARMNVVEPYVMDNKIYESDSSCSWRSALTSRPLVGFYACLAAAGVVAALIIGASTSPEGSCSRGSGASARHTTATAA